MITYYDIGLNLFTSSFPDPEKIISEAEAAGICCILTGSEAAENEKVNDFVKTHAVYGTAGIHPHSADRAEEADLCRIEEIVSSNPKIVAVGECGLDYDRMYSSRENQLYYFKKLIALAEKLEKPLFLHQRDAEEDFLACFDGHEEICRRSVVHCYTGNREMAEKLVGMGFYIGITGWICDERRAGDLREAVKYIPLERILLETDAPYLTPRGIPGLKRTNVPQNIVYVAQALAHYMGVSAEEVTGHAKANTERLFGI